MTMTIKVTAAQVIIDHVGPDTILLDLELPNPCYPYNGTAYAKITAARETGAQYVRDHLSIEPEVIDTRHPVLAVA